MELLTQAFLRQYGVDQITLRYSIAARRHGEFPNLIQFKYDQIASPMAEPIVQECRGLILDEADDWRVVAFPYRKFFNYGEGHAAPIDWSTATVYEKLDGSLMTMYWYAGEWRIASSGLPDASGPVPGCGSTFAELFWKTWRELRYMLPPSSCAERRCFMFELMTPYNRIVCKQEKPRIVLHGVRSIWPPYGELWPQSYAELYGWERARSYPLITLDDCVAAAQQLDPMDAEGYVVCDGSFHRVKVKSPAYVALSNLKDGMSERRLLEIVRTNESSEFLAHFPEFTDDYNACKARFEALVEALECAYERIKHIPDQKAFALEAVKTPFSSALFSVRKGTARSMRAFLAECSIQSIERALFETADKE